jgi:hypothetical protein
LIIRCSDDDPCEDARHKLDSCNSEIQRAVAAHGYASFPLTFEGECSGKNRCIAECARNVGCDELASTIAGESTDPNAPVMSGEFFGCALRCLGELTPSPRDAGTDAGRD